MAESVGTDISHYDMSAQWVRILSFTCASYSTN